jgi:glycosyltransferase involved in cell wall biosynthesis
MKIVQLLPELNEGGVERGVVDLNKELVKRGHQSIVISNGGKLAEQIDQDGGKHITFDICSKNIFTFIPRVFKLRKILKELKPDIIHARSRVPAWIAHFANKSLNIPFVTTVHGFNSVGPYSEVMTFGDSIICVSTAIKEYIQSNYQTNPAKITVIPRGIDLVKFNPNNLDASFIDEFKKQYKLEDKYIVTTVGRITQLKDIETLIRAIGEDLPVNSGTEVSTSAKTELSSENPGTEVLTSAKTSAKKDTIALIVGGVREDKQDYYQSLKDLAKELNIEDKIIFTGSQSKVAEIYSISDVVVSSSKKPETFGRSAAEALAMNTPVIASNHGGILDIVKQDQTGWLFEVGDSNQLAQNIEQSKQTKLSKLREFVEERFTLDNMVDMTLEVYRKYK